MTNLGKRLAMIVLSAAMTITITITITLIPVTGVQTVYAEDEETNEIEVQHPTPEPGFIDDSVPALSIHDGNEAKGSARAAATLPKAYSSVKKGYVTSVKNQEDFEICWAFASISSIESSLLAHGQADKSSLDLSERQLAYFMYHKANDALGNIGGDYSAPLDPAYSDEGDDKYLYTAGSSYQVYWTLASWKGVADETLGRSDPKLTFESLVDEYYSYDPDDEDSMNQFYQETALDENLSYSANKWHLNGAYNIAIRDSADAKKAIMEYGAVTAPIYMDEAFYDEDNAAYYNSEVNSTNHIISIVGWDDSYPKENFGASDKGPESNGAWLCKNSWGSQWGQDGYFWLSYEDAYFTGDSYHAKGTAFALEPASELDNIYQYDGGTSTWYEDFESGGSVANVYTVKGNPGGAEELRSVGFGITYDVNVDYSIQVYTNLADKNDPTSGTAMLDQPVTGKTSYAGYYTADLPTPVYLQEGSNYSIVITLSHRDMSKVKVDIDVSAKNDFVSWHTKAVPGQSFDKHSKDGKWNDLSIVNSGLNHNHSMTIRIKGMTVNTTRKVQDISGASVSGISDKTHTGKAITQSPIVKVGSSVLTNGTDYTVAYKNNINAGTATATITGKGNYTGSISRNFKILRAANRLKCKGKTVTVKYNKIKKKAQRLSVTKAIKFANKGQGKKIYTLSSAKKGKKNFKKKFVVNKKTGKVTVKKGLKKGVYKVKVKVKAKGNANYKASAWKKVTITVKVR